MKISRIDVYQLDIPLSKPMIYPHKTYRGLDDTIVRLESDSGLVGWGEVCPLSTTYQAAHGRGVRADIAEMAPGLLGEDPTQTNRINETMNSLMMGASYAKSAIDIACWDLTGKAYNKPVYHLIGGRMQAKARCYPSIGIAGDNVLETVATEMAQYRAEGYRHFQLKVGRNSTIDLDIARIRAAGQSIQPGETLVADANKAWQVHEAIRILRATEDVDYYIEQPCLTYEECLAVRRRARQPLILDESLADIKVLLRGLADDCFDGIGCKITRVGGISAMRLIRDVCRAAGKVMTVDDAWGADLSAAAQAHLAVATPKPTFFAAYISTCFSELRYDMEAPYVVDGFIQPTEKPGLGVTPDLEMLGEPVLSLG
ncbi:MAG: enolase C-terminal domain-like protein [Chloroflexota bacterium]